MKNQKSIPFFIFILLVSLFLYFLTATLFSGTMALLGKFFSLAAFALALLGLFIASIRNKRSWSRYYYIALFVVMLILLVFEIMDFALLPMAKLFFVTAALVALLLSLLDYRQYILAKLKVVRRYLLKVKEQESQLVKLEKEQENKMTRLEKAHDNALAKKDKELQAKLKLVASYKTQNANKADEVKKIKAQLAEVRKDMNKASREIKKSQEIVSELDKKKQALAEKNKTLSKKTAAIAEMSKETNTLKRQLNKSQKELDHEAELKSKYSKTLRNIRKAKKEEEELLIVSADGSSVHRPKCIAVRNVLKENRKLIKNWKAAEKEGYKGCKLCKPHIKPKVIVKNHVKYKFVGSKDSDKVHKASCLLVKNIDSKDRLFFRSYKAALQKKYTACRVCNPTQ